MFGRVLGRVVVLAVPLLAFGLSAAPAQDEHPVVTLIKSKVKDVNKPFALSVEFKVKPGKEEEFEKAFAPCLIATRKEPGCTAYYLNRDPDRPEIYVMYEQFKGIAALEAHMKEKHTQTLLKTVATLTEGDPKIKVWLVPE
jgi:quinol monooxygenase YgiN